MLGLIIKGQSALASKKADNETTLMSFKDVNGCGWYINTEMGFCEIKPKRFIEM